MAGSGCKLRESVFQPNAENRGASRTLGVLKERARLGNQGMMTKDVTAESLGREDPISLVC